MSLLRETVRGLRAYKAEAEKPKAEEPPIDTTAAREELARARKETDGALVAAREAAAELKQLREDGLQSTEKALVLLAGAMSQLVQEVRATREQLVAIAMHSAQPQPGQTKMIDVVRGEDGLAKSYAVRVMH
jgi:hypothetical protein